MTNVTGRFEASRGFRLGAGLGALVLTAAGMAWSLIALLLRQGSAGVQFAAATVPAALIALIVVRQLTIVAKLPAPEPTALERFESRRQGRRMGARFAAICGVEAALIAASALVLGNANRPLLIPVAVVAIVGAHFVPLARVFRIGVYAVTGLVLIALAGLSLLVADESQRIFGLAIATTLVLWASAVAVLVIHVGAHVSGRSWSPPVV